MIVFGIDRLPSGKHTENYGKSPFLMGKSTISMVIFNGYFDITRGYIHGLSHPVPIPVMAQPVLHGSKLCKGPRGWSKARNSWTVPRWDKRGSLSTGLKKGIGLPIIIIIIIIIIMKQEPVLLGYDTTPIDVCNHLWLELHPQVLAKFAQSNTISVDPAVPSLEGSIYC